jgi:hypothetical protein
MSSNMSRRKFLKAATVVTACGIFSYSGGWWFFKVRNHDSTDFISAVLWKKLSWLQLEEEGVNAFAHDYNFQRLTSWAGMVVPLYEYVDVFELTPLAGEFQEIEDKIVLLYLLSTDFFLNDADESKVVKYLGYYDPYSTDFINPLARF